MYFKEQMKKSNQGMKSMMQSQYEEAAQFMDRAKGSFHLKMWDAESGKVLTEWDKPNVEKVVSDA